MSKFNIFRTAYDALLARQELMYTLVLTALLLVTPLPVVGSDEVPEAIDGAKIISAESVFDAVLDDSALVIIDARHNGDRDQGYIEGSVSLPDTNTDCYSLTKIIPTYDTPAMFYCNGLLCMRSANAINKAITCGYKKVYWLRGGFDEWKIKGFAYLSK